MSGASENANKSHKNEENYQGYRQELIRTY